MRVGLIVISAALLLAACSRSGSDRLEGAPSAGKKAKAEITLSEDIKKAGKRLPETLAGDSANAAHLGDPIPPQ